MRLPQYETSQNKHEEKTWGNSNAAMPNDCTMNMWVNTYIRLLEVEDQEKKWNYAQ